MKMFVSGPRLLAFALLVAVAALSAPSAFAQNGSVSGVVTDADDGGQLAGANVQVIGNSGSMLTGTATDIDGRYTLTGIAAGSYTIRASFIGYGVSDATVQIVSGQTATVDFALTVGITLNTVVVTSGRQPEKVLDAPASISVLTAKDMTSDVGMSSVEALRNTTGVDIAQTGVDRRELVLRGFNNAFSGATYVLTDYRQAAAPSLGVNLYSLMPNINIDVDRVEVVRGPGSALYGAGVDSGVIHFITKGPFEHPGTTISVSGGERSYMGVQFRHAGVLSPKFGYKITGTVGQANDWEMDPSDPTDAQQLAGDVTARNNDFEKLNLNGNFEFRPKAGTSIIGNFGYSELTATVLSGIGTLQAIGFGYKYGQLRLQTGNFFAQTYVNQNNAGESYVYDQDFNGDGVPDPVTDNGIQVAFQAQYDYQMSNKQSFIIGADADLTRPDTDGTILGRNEDMDSINEYGAYIQSQTALSPKFDMVLALRGDYNDVLEAATVSPRAAFVFKAASNHSFRATFNRAFSSPGTNSNFLDIVASTSPLVARGRGTAGGFTWERDASYRGLGAITDLAATSLLPNSLGELGPVGADLTDIYELVYGGLAAMGVPQITGILNAQGIPVNDAITGQLLALLSPAGGTNVTGFSPGIMGILNLTTGSVGSFADDLSNIKPLEQTTTQTFEVGYKGFIANKFSFTVDAYYTQKENFIGPLLLETPLVLTPNLAGDLSAALAAGIQGNAPLAGALGSFGLTPAAVAGLIVQLSEPSFPSAVGIVQPAENNPGVGIAPELMLSYRNFGKLSYSGVDVSMDYFHSDQLSFFANVSWVSDSFFDSTELEEENTDLELALNATTFKGRVGVRYEADSGLSANVAMRYTDGFPIRSGPYIGDLPSFTLVDVSLGYDLSATVPGLTLNVGVNNALNESHREFIGAPLLGRMVIGRMTYSF